MTARSGGQVALGIPTPLKWVDDQTGYRCPMCALCVALPKEPLATCPRCAVPVDEAATLILAHAGFDESDRERAVEALRPLLGALLRFRAGGAMIEILDLLHTASCKNCHRSLSFFQSGLRGDWYHDEGGQQTCPGAPTACPIEDSIRNVPRPISRPAEGGSDD